MPIELLLHTVMLLHTTMVLPTIMVISTVVIPLQPTEMLLPTSLILPIATFPVTLSDYTGTQHHVTRRASDTPSVKRHQVTLVTIYASVPLSDNSLPLLVVNQCDLQVPQ